MFVKNWFYIKKDAPGIQKDTISNTADTYLNIVDFDSPNSGNIISVDNFTQILPPGPAGPEGIQGPAGPLGPVGPAGLNWQGAWVSGDSYVADDAVGYDGASWFCILATSGTTTPNSDPTHWALLASQGAEGIQGAQGPTGPQGPAGASGSVPNLEFNATDKTVWNNGQGNVASNTSFGDGALKANTIGAENTAVGYTALTNNTSGTENTSVGHNSLTSNTTGSYNTAIGKSSLASNTTASGNTAVGHNSLATTTGANNVAVGLSSMLNLAGGQQNVAIGVFANQASTSGIANTAIGYNALGNDVTGNSNTAVGHSTASGGFTGSVILGANATATANNQFVVGSAAINAGAVTTETPATTTRTWTVRVNGVNYKIPMYVA